MRKAKFNPFVLYGIDEATTSNDHYLRYAQQAFTALERERKAKARYNAKKAKYHV